LTTIHQTPLELVEEEIEEKNEEEDEDV